MKSNVTMSSPDRELFGVIVKQHTQNSLVNLSAIQEAYTRERVKNGWPDKRIADILSSKSNAERVFYILEQDGHFNAGFSAFMEGVEKEGLTKTLKKIGVYKTTGARHTKATWCNVYIAVMIGLELHPKFYAKIVKWVTDDLIVSRIEAGNFYKELTSAMRGSFGKDVDYAQIAKALNYIIFDKHEPGIRNNATQKELKELERIESQMAFAINMGYVKTYQALIEELRKIYNKKFPKRLSA